MSKNTNNKNVSNDEIDLLDLFRRMGNTLSRWLKSLGRAFLISGVFLLRRWLPLGLSVVAAIVLSLILKNTSESFFTSDLTLRSNAAPPSDIISWVNRLHVYCVEGNKPALSNALSINQESIENILDISAFWVIDQNNDDIPDYVDYKNNHNVYDTTNVRMQDRLDIRVKITSTQELTMLRDGIISFLERDSLFQQKNRLRIRQNQELLARLDHDILQLDSLQKVKYFEETRSRQPQGGGQMIFLQEQKTQLVYSDIYELYERKQALEAERDLYQGIVTILSDFSIPAKRDNGGFYYSRTYVPLFFILTLIVLIIFANRNKLLEVYRKY